MGWRVSAWPAAGPCGWDPGDGWWLLGLAVGALIAALAARRAVTALRTLPARALTPLLFRHLARWVRVRSYSDEEFFRADGAGEPWIERRKAGVDRLSRLLGARHPRSTAWGEAIRITSADPRFTDANRVPAPFARFMRERFNLCSVVTASDGPLLQDLHGALDRTTPGPGPSSTSARSSSAARDRGALGPRSGGTTGARGILRACPV